MITNEIKKKSRQRLAIKQRYAIGNEASTASKLVGLFRPPASTKWRLFDTIHAEKGVDF